MYMGRRYVGGGQIFPQNQQNSPRPNQNPPYQQSQHLSNMHQQLQMVQMHLQQNLNQAPKINQNQNAKNSGPGGDNAKGKGNAGPGSEPIQPSANDKQNPKNKTQEVKPPHNQSPHDKSQSNNQNKSQGNLQTGGPKQENPTPNKGAKQDNFDNNKGQIKMGRFGSSPQQDPSKVQPQQQSTPNQQASLMGQPPALMMSPTNLKREIKNSPSQPRSMNDSYNKNANEFAPPPDQHNNSFENQEHGKQSSFRGRFSKSSQRGSPQGQRNITPQHPHDPDRSGRNMNTRPSDNKSRTPNTSRQGGRGGGSGSTPHHSGGPRGPSKGFYYGSGDKVKEKLTQIFTEPALDLPAMDMSEKKFNNHAKLFIGNIPKNCEQKDIVSLFEQYGEIGSVYLNKDSAFAFINFDYKVNASKALRELDNTLVKNRHLKVRFATISEGIRVKNLSPYVSNELLEKSFSIFGMIESCRVSVDERGMSKGEGVIIFRDKKSAVMAIKKCQEECFFLSGALRPVIVSTLDPLEDLSEGLSETSLPRNEDFRTEREIVPHFAESNSFEFEFGLQWKQLFSMYEDKKSVLDRDFQIEMERLEKKMVLAKVEYETDKLRKELAQREAESAELRRHFDYDGSNNYSSPAIGPSSTAASASYDPYPGSKRPLDQGYDGSFSGPYDPAYPDNYDRASGYPPADYDRNYDQGYGNYGRDEYRREGGYGPDDPYDRPPYDHPTDISSERPPPMFDNPADQGYAKPAEAPLAGEPFKAPSKRPRY